MSSRMSRMPKKSSMKASQMGQGGHLVQMRRPKAIVFDILGTASKSGFLEKILFPFLNTNLEHYISTHWNAKDFVKVHQRIVEHSQELNQQEPQSPIVLAHDNEQSKQTLLAFIAYATERSLQLPGVTRLRFMVWFEGYQQSKLRTPIYRDVPDKMKRWFSEGIKFYVFSNTWVEAQKALLRNTNHGDLTNLITDHFDNDFGQLTDPSSWTRLCSQIGQSPTDVLFMTKAPLEGRAAAEAGISVVLVLTHRHNVRAVTDEDRRHFPYVRTLNDLTWVESQLSRTGNVASGATSQAGASQAGASQVVGSQAGGSQAGGSQAGGSQAAASTAPTSGTGTGTGSPSSPTSGATGATEATSATGGTSTTGGAASSSQAPAATGTTSATGGGASSGTGAPASSRPPGSNVASSRAGGSSKVGPGSKVSSRHSAQGGAGSSATGAASSSRPGSKKSRPDANNSSHGSQAK